MSISWYIYRAEPGAGPIYTWDTDRSERVATLDIVKSRLTIRFPNLRWQMNSFQIAGQTQVSHSALAGSYKPGDEYLDLSLSVDTDGYVRMIIARKASPKVVIAIMEEFSLDSVYQDQPGVMVDPNAFDKNWSPKR